MEETRIKRFNRSSLQKGSPRTEKEPPIGRAAPYISDSFLGLKLTKVLNFDMAGHYPAPKNQS